MHFQILTPEKTAFDGEVEIVSAPGETGGFQILKDHAPILSGLVPGPVKLVVNGKTEMFHVAHGFLEFSHNRGVILTDAVERPGEIDLDRARAAREKAQKMLDNREKVDLIGAHKALTRALSREKFRERFPG